jgi:predicted metal-dependent phosphoesterase TrpH
MRKKIDLHAHSHYSDGACAPAEVIRRAAAGGLDVVALTDHDTVGGASEAETEARKAGIRLLVGFELTTHRQGEDVHILAYFCDLRDARLLRFLDGLKIRRLERIRQMASRLEAAGIKVRLDEVLPKLPSATVGRPHLARALVDQGWVRSVDEAFDRYLHKKSAYFVPCQAPSPEEGIRSIREAGGVPVVAHPGNYRDDAFIEPLAERGLGGIEVHHPDNAGKIDHYQAMARRRGLIATGGSDFHGHSEIRYAALGAFCCPEEEFQKLEAAGRART